MIRARIFLVWLLVFSLLTPAGFSLAQLFEDSNIFTLKTEQTSAQQEETPYSFNCQRLEPNTASTISWYGGYRKDQHRIEIYEYSDINQAAEGGTILQNSARNSSLVASGLYSGFYQVPPGSYDHQNLDPARTYYYRIKVTYTGGSNRSPDWFPSASPLSCPPQIATDAPTQLNVWAFSPTSLFVNWKDNATNPNHTFEVQRIKLTPKQPVFAFDSSSLPSEERQIVKTISSDAIRLRWKNETNSTAVNCQGGTTNGLCKGPFFHVFERVNCGADGTIDGPRDQRLCSANTNPFFDNQGQDTFKSNSTAATIRRAFPEDVNPAQSVKIYYDLDDTGLKEGTEYFYRLKACSFIKADFTRDGVDNVTDVCSKYADSPAFVATTTLPAKPELRFTDTTENSLTFKVINYSQRAEGLEIEIISCLDNSCTQNKIEVNKSDLPKEDKEGREVEVYERTIGGYQPGYTITVKARAYKDNKLGEGGKVYSEQEEKSTTLRRVVAVFEKAPYETRVKQRYMIPNLPLENISNIFGRVASLFPDYWNWITYRVAPVVAQRQTAISFRQRILDFFTAIFEKPKEAVALERHGLLSGVELSDSNLETYFAQFKVDGRDLSSGERLTRLNLSTFRDDNLEPDTVYYYRVRACYTGSNTRCTAWLAEGAGKTLSGAGRAVNKDIGICVRNSLCERQQRVKYVVDGPPLVESAPDDQCLNTSPLRGNAACRNVGASRQFFEEVKPR